ncbi:MAG: sarcosine oxidase subunit gamma [Paracoccaceae bacterium]
MVELVAQSPCAGLLPLRIGGATLLEEDPGHLTALLPAPGAEDSLSRALKAAHGVDWPAPGRMETAEGAAALWFGHAQALLIGPAPDPSLSTHAALVDQSDAWAVVRLEGAGAENVLARLVPLDLRAAAFPPGSTARSLLGHMTASVTRLPQGGFRLMVFRSMARTLVHDLHRAMDGVAARAQQG